MASLLILEGIELISNAEKLKDFWDEKGLDMHIAVKLDGRVAVSTKHWVRTHYINTHLRTPEIWVEIQEVMEKVGRSLIKSKLGTYVFVPKLNIESTQRIFDEFKKRLGYDISREWGLSWDIDDAVLP